MQGAAGGSPAPGPPDGAAGGRDLAALIATLAADVRACTAAGDPCAEAMACMRLGDALANLQGNLTAGRAWYARAWRLVADLEPCVEQGWVAVAGLGCDAGDPEDLLTRAELALDRARRFADLNLETKALADGGLAHVQAGRVDAGFAMLDEGMALACGPADDDETRAKSACSLFTACWYTAAFDRAETWAAELRRHGLIETTSGEAAFVSDHCASLQATFLVELGRWREARDLLTGSRAAFERATGGRSFHSALALADRGRGADVGLDLRPGGRDRVREVPVVVDRAHRVRVQLRRVVTRGRHLGERQALVHHPVNIILLDVREQNGRGRLRHVNGAGAAGRIALAGVRQLGVRALEIVDGQADLLQVVLASAAGGGVADLLDRGEEQADQDRDDRDHDQQLDQRKRGPASVEGGRQTHSASSKRFNRRDVRLVDDVELQINVAN